MDQRYANDIRFYYNKNLDQNLAWLAQKTKESKSNKGNLSDSIFRRSYPPSLIRGRGGGGCPTMRCFNVFSPFDIILT